MKERSFCVIKDACISDIRLIAKVLRFAVLNKSMLLTINNYSNTAIKDSLKPLRLELAKEFNLSQSLDAELDNRLRLKENKEHQMKANVQSDYNNK